jgi:hypothetical protein
MNLILITSVLYPLNPGVFSPKERLEQLIRFTIPSIRKKIPDCYLVVVEGSEITKEEKTIISNNCDELFLFDIKNFDKNMGEINLIYSFLISDSFDKLKNKMHNFIKISGRYHLSDEFEFEKYSGSIIKNEKSIRSDCNVSHTTLYKVFKSDMNSFVEKIFNILKGGIFIDIEHTFYKYNVVPCSLEIEKLGIAGLCSHGHYYQA